MITYTSTIEGIKYHKTEGILQNVIKSIKVTKTGVHSDGYTNQFSDTLNFETPNESQFTPYENITEEMMLSWIELHPSNFNEKSEFYISNSLQQQIESNEVITSQLPYQ
jgi:hypothetical protein